MFARKTDKTKDASRSGTTLRKDDANSAKSPRENNNDQLTAPIEPAGDGVMTFVVGDVKVALTHAKLLQDNHFYDMEINLGKKQAPVHVHRAILDVRLPGLLSDKFSRVDQSRPKWVATVNENALPHMSSVVLTQILLWAYSGSVEVSRFNQLPTVLDVCACATTLGLAEIKWLCEHRIREALSNETVHAILKGSEDRKLDDVRNFSLEYAFAHWNEFIGNQTGAKVLGLELFQDVSARFAKGERHPTPESAQPPNTVMADFRKLYDKMPHYDMQLDVGGKKINCHRAILGMYSDSLGQRLRSHLKGHATPVRLIDVQEPGDDLKSPGAVESFLRFVYYGETRMDPIDACEMIHKVNSVYKVQTFQLLCEYTIINNINAKSVLPILGVTYIPNFDTKPHIQALRKHALGHLISQFGTIDLQSLNAMHPQIRTDLLVALQSAFKSGKLGQPQDNTTTHTDTHSAADDEAAVAVEDSE